MSFILCALLAVMEPLVCTHIIYACILKVQVIVRNFIVDVLTTMVLFSKVYQTLPGFRVSLLTTPCVSTRH